MEDVEMRNESIGFMRGISAWAFVCVLGVMLIAIIITNFGSALNSVTYWRMMEIIRVEEVAFSIGVSLMMLKIVSMLRTNMRVTCGIILLLLPVAVFLLHTIHANVWFDDTVPVLSKKVFAPGYFNQSLFIEVIGGYNAVQRILSLMYIPLYLLCAVLLFTGERDYCTYAKGAMFAAMLGLALMPLLEAYGTTADWMPRFLEVWPPKNSEVPIASGHAVDFLRRCVPVVSKAFFLAASVYSVVVIKK